MGNGGPGGAGLSGLFGTPGNASGGNGGAAGSAGGVDASGSPVAISRTTISSNVLGAPGPGAPGNGSSVNGVPGAPGTAGGILGSAGTSLAQSILSANAAPTCAGAIADGLDDFKLPADPACPGTSTDPLLGPLADNGGGTFTRAIPATSPAANRYACTGFDERGVTRPAGAQCDSGAYEVALPEVSTPNATPTATSAMFGATVNPNARAKVVFDYGRTTTYGDSTDEQTADSRGDPLPVAATVTGLQPLTTYHVRVRATNADGTSTSNDRTFTTPAVATPRDRTKPVIARLKASPSTFAVSKKHTAITAATKKKAKKVPVGTKVEFRLSEAAAVRISFARKTTGVKVKSKTTHRTSCHATKHLPQKRSSRCTLYVSKGSLHRKGKKGTDVFSFTGRVGSEALPTGTYRLSVYAVDHAGNRSKTATATFRVVAAPKPKAKKK